MKRRQMLVVSSAVLAGCAGNKEAPKEDQAKAPQGLIGTPPTPQDLRFKADFNRTPSGAVLPSAARKLTDSEAAVEAQVLAILLMALHPDDFQSIATSATPTGNLQGVNAAVYTSMYEFFKGDALRQSRMKLAVKAFREVIETATTSALHLTDDPYDDDPRGCLSPQTIGKVKAALNKANM